MSVTVLGAGRKAVHLCNLFNLWDELTQFYDTPLTKGETKNGIPIEITLLSDNPQLVYSAVGDTRQKRDLVLDFQNVALGNKLEYTWGKLKHITSVVTCPNHIGIDFSLRELSSIGSNVYIGDHVSIGPLANISHDSYIGDYSTICGGVKMSGGVFVGEGVFIGQGASIKPDARIGNGAVIGTGSTVVKDVPPNTVVANDSYARGNPKFKGVMPW